MTALIYFSGLISIVTIGAGIALLYINVPQTVHLDIKQPNALLKLVSIILILEGALNLIGDAYFGIRHWRESREPVKQTETPKTVQPPSQRQGG